jgi:hypothetical protein
MKRFLILFLPFVTFASSAVSDAPGPRLKNGERSSAIGGKVSIPCPIILNNIADCPETGCGPSIDPQLNKRKNIRSDDRTPEIRNFKDLRNLPDPVLGYAIGDTRERLAEAHEGEKIRVVALALVARKGSKESCNCALIAPADTDNTIVLVDSSLMKPTLAANETDSLSAEFTPRVRLNHPGLAGAKLQPLITAASGALLVRVTGLLMFDSEHSLSYPLRRHNNWEIHPVLGMEYCPKGKKCTAGNEANWKDLEK